MRLFLFSCSTLRNTFVLTKELCRKARLLFLFPTQYLSLCHTFLQSTWKAQCMCVKSFQSCLTLCDPTDCSPSLLWPWDSPGKRIGVGCHFLLQGIFLTQGWNTCLFYLLYWQTGSLSLEPPTKPRNHSRGQQILLLKFQFMCNVCIIIISLLILGSSVVDHAFIWIKICYFSVLPWQSTTKLETTSH